MGDQTKSPPDWMERDHYHERERRVDLCCKVAPFIKNRHALTWGLPELAREQEKILHMTQLFANQICAHVWP